MSVSCKFGDEPAGSGATDLFSYVFSQPYVLLPLRLLCIHVPLMYRW
jgi:hypothetical protein